jgi:hypothetical protein
MFNKKLCTSLILLLILSLILVGCNNLRPINPQTQQPTTPPKQATDMNDITITYNYGDTGPVQLSATDPTLKVGQRLVLQPAPGMSKNTRFVSSGENFFGDIMEQVGDQSGGKLIFVAKKPGRGRLQIIPNTNETNRATDLWATVTE